MKCIRDSSAFPAARGTVSQTNSTRFALRGRSEADLANRAGREERFLESQLTCTVSELAFRAFFTGADEQCIPGRCGSACWTGGPAGDLNRCRGAPHRPRSGPWPRSAAPVRPGVYRAGAATQEETAVSVIWRSGRWTRSQWTAFPGSVQKGVCFVSGCPREPLMQTEPASAEGVQQTLDAVVEHLLTFHRAASFDIFRDGANLPLLFHLPRCAFCGPDGCRVGYFHSGPRVASPGGQGWRGRLAALAAAGRAGVVGSGRYRGYVARWRGHV